MNFPMSQRLSLPPNAGSVGRSNRLRPMESNEDLVPPFTGNDQRDMWAFDQLSAHGIESFDAAQTEVFDSEGRILRPVVEGYSVRYEVDTTKPPDPDRLLGLIQGFFQRFTKEQTQPFRIESESCQSLADFVALLVRFGNRT
jgi:hypothetical protein